MPAEHGGWGLTLEPGILAVLAAPSVAGVLLAVAALLLFLVRTPLRLVLIGRHRAGRRETSRLGQARTHLATRVAGAELVVAGVAVMAAIWLATEPWWWLPAVIATPLFAVALWFDMRSRSRHLVPEVVGSIAVASVAAMGALAGGAEWPLALGLWAILTARIVSSIPHVRVQVLRIHGVPAATSSALMGDIAALAIASVAVVLLDRSLLFGTLAIVGLVAIQQVTLRRPPRPAKVLGVRQMILGFSVVGVTALGVWLL